MNILALVTGSGSGQSLVDGRAAGMRLRLGIKFYRDLARALLRDHVRLGADVVDHVHVVVAVHNVRLVD